MTQSMTDELKLAHNEADALIAVATSVDALRQAESRLLGKQGTLGKLLASIGQLPKEQRGPAGKEINLAKQAITERFAAARARLEHAGDQQAVAGAQAYDPTLPGRCPSRQRAPRHCRPMGDRDNWPAWFVVVSGPRRRPTTTTSRPFNIPAMHPAAICRIPPG
jgi:phenylalanyl-tRNA synthetase alpha subunit